MAKLIIMAVNKRMDSFKSIIRNKKGTNIVSTCLFTKKYGMLDVDVIVFLMASHKPAFYIRLRIWVGDFNASQYNTIKRI